MKYIALVGVVLVGVRQGFSLESVLLVLFLTWAVPLDYFRTKFRMIVYDTTDWKIAIRPVFLREIRALLGLYTSDHPQFIRYRSLYGAYLVCFFILFQLWRHSDKIALYLFS